MLLQTGADVGKLSKGWVMPSLEQEGFCGFLRTDVGDSKCPIAGDTVLGVQPGTASRGDKVTVTEQELFPRLSWKSRACGSQLALSPHPTPAAP